MNKKVTVFVRVCLSIVCIICMLFAFVGCNYNLIDIKWNFKYAYITLPGSNKTIEIEVESWSDESNSGGSNITITSKDDIAYCTDYKNVVLTTERIR